MKSLATCAIALALCFGGAASVLAQAAAPATAPAAPAAAPAAETPAQPPAAAPTAAPAEAAPPPALPAEAAAPAAEEPLPDPAATEQDRQLREAERARIRLLLARARSERAEREAAQLSQQPAPQPEPARHGDAGAAIAVGFSMELPWHTERQFDLFSDDDIGPRYGLWATYDVLAFGDRTFLAAGAGFDVESLDENNLFNALDTELRAVVLYGTAVVRHVVTDWLQPHARLSLGAQLVRSRLDFSGTTYENNGDLPFGSLSTGFTLRSPSRLFESRRGQMASLSFGVMVEGGYTLASSLDMKVDGDGPEDRDISLIESDLPDLDRSGPFMRISVVSRF